MFRSPLPRGVLGLLVPAVMLAFSLPATAAPSKKKDDKFKHFGEVTEDTEHLTGFFDLYRKDDKVHLEIPLDRLDEEFLFIGNLSQGIGMRGILGGLFTNIFEADMLRFERHGDKLHLVQVNTHFTADAGTPMANAVELSYSHSIVASFDIVSERHEGDEVGVVPEPPAEEKDEEAPADTADVVKVTPDDADGDEEADEAEMEEEADDEDEASDDEAEEDAEEEAEEPETPVVSLVIDFTPYLMSDIANMQGRLSDAFPKGGFKIDKDRSRIASVKVFPDNAEFNVKLGFAGSGKDFVATVPDSRYLTLGLHYSFSRLPEEPMMPRLADDRVGYFLTAKKDFSRDEAQDYMVRYINRWRLEKKNPNSDMSEPVEPIVYYIEDTIPEEYHKYVKRGVEMWQKAFEAAGFENAIIAKPQPKDDPDWAAEDVRYSTLRWITSHQPSFGAIGPSRVDPRTGEILDADILFESNMVQGFRSTWRRYVGDVAVGPDGELEFPWERAERAEQEAFAAMLEDPEAFNVPGLHCSLGHGFVESGAFLNAVLMTRGEVLPGDPVPMDYVGEALSWVVAHEVGHTLGLRHNFKSSRSTPYDKLHDKGWVKENGLYGSVMEYPTVNVAADGEKQGYYYSPTVGNYDVWAIRYGYTPVKGAKKPADETKTLAAIAAEGTDPLKAYGSDQDAWIGGTDPRTSTFDLSDDPLAWADHRASLMSSMWGDLEDRSVAEGQPWNQLTRNFQTVMGQYASTLIKTSRYIGARHQSLAHRGDPGADLPFTPVDPEEQRRALAIIAEHAFSPTPFQLPPDMYGKLTANNFATWGESPFIAGRRDYPYRQAVLSVQRLALTRILHPVTIAKVADSELQTENPFTLVELMTTLNGAIWSELDGTAGAAQIDGLRRQIQRDWTNRLIGISLNQGSGPMADARAVSRMVLRDLADGLDGAVSAGTGDDYTRAHLMDTRDLVRKALDAGLESELMMIMN
jgi:hypothetical protein